MRYVLLGLVPAIALNAAIVLQHLDSRPSVPPPYEYLLRTASSRLDTMEAISVLTKAREAMRKEEWGLAQQLFNQLGRQMPAIRDWSYTLASAAAAAKGDTIAADRGAQLAGSYLQQERAWRFRIESRIQARNFESAWRVARMYGETLPGDNERARAWLLGATARLSLGDTATAISALQRSVSSAPASPAAKEAAPLLVRLAGSQIRRSPALARAFLSRGEPDNAYKYTPIPGDSATPNEWNLFYDVGSSLARTRQCDLAKEVLSRVEKQHPAKETRAQAAYDLAVCYLRSGQRTRAVGLLQSLGQTHPGTRAHGNAEFLLGDLAHDREDWRSAKLHYTKALRLGGNHTATAVARFASRALLDRTERQALDTIEASIPKIRSTTDRQAAHYWAGRLYESIGEPEKARDAWNAARSLAPLTYYGIRAAERLGKPLRLSVTRPFEPVPDSIQVLIEGGIRRWVILQRAGFTAEANLESNRLRAFMAQRGDAAFYALAEALQKAGDVFTGISIGRELERRPDIQTRDVLPLIYPFPQQGAIVARANQLGLNPFLVAGLIRQESMFNAQSVSPAGAVGLMQVMPQTGAQIAQKYNIPNFRANRLEDPELNLVVGTYYLRDLLQRYSGRIDETLAAYNAGPHRVATWKTYSEYGDEDMWIERIPFTETRNYVKIVKANTAIYQALYQNAQR